MPSVMETFFERIVTKAGRIVRHWWMLLVTGLLLVAGGIVVFCSPVDCIAVFLSRLIGNFVEMGD